MLAEALVKRGDRALILGPGRKRTTIELIATDGPRPELVITELEPSLRIEGPAADLRVWDE